MGGRWGQGVRGRGRGEVSLWPALWDFLGGVYLPLGYIPWAVLASQGHWVNQLSPGPPSWDSLLFAPGAKPPFLRPPA